LIIATDLIRQSILDAGKLLLEKAYVARTWGNISARIDENWALITPSGRKYEDLTPNDLVTVNIIDNCYSGQIKPSSEYRLHTAIYRTRKNISAVIHTHQMNASTVAAARREVPPILDDMVQIIGPNVRVADYALPSTKKIVKATVKALKGRQAALMANHGAVCIGRDMDEALVVTEILEKTCKAFIEAEFLGQAKKINKFEAHFMHQYYLLKYSKKVQTNK